jgi:NAD-dependent SIR2 family protein deacetylase
MRETIQSNVGVTEASRTAWIFGAGASAHLGFPLSGTLFSESIKLVTRPFISYRVNRSDVRYTGLKVDLTARGMSVPTKRQVAEFKTNAELALSYRHMWERVKPEPNAFAPIRVLYELWMKLPERLQDIGLSISCNELISSYPEVLIQRVRSISPHQLRRDKELLDDNSARLLINDALTIITQVYFQTLSHFNESARGGIRDKRLRSLYVQLVRGFALENNCRIIAFNYDTMLDEAVFEHFTRSWQYGGIQVAGFNGYPVARGNKADLVIIKPHGSLNYLLCKNCNRAHVHWFWNYKQTGVGVASSDNRRCVHCRAAQQGRTELLDNLVVAPLYDKKVMQRSGRAIVDAFKWATNIVAVGYSFPDQDECFYRYMRDGIARNPTSPITFVIVSQSFASANQIKRRLEANLGISGSITRKRRFVAKRLTGFQEVKAAIGFVPV